MKMYSTVQSYSDPVNSGMKVVFINSFFIRNMQAIFCDDVYLALLCILQHPYVQCTLYSLDRIVLCTVSNVWELFRERVLHRKNSYFNFICTIHINRLVLNVHYSFISGLRINLLKHAILCFIFIGGKKITI